MAITAKEIAKILGISPAAVSIAINNKPGVSSATRERVLQRPMKTDMSFLAEKTRTSARKRSRLSFIRSPAEPLWTTRRFSPALRKEWH